MRLRTIAILVLLGLIVVFAMLNWSAFVTPSALSLGVATVQAPLGLLMLGATALLTVLFLVFIVYLQSSVLLQTRRHARELQSQRELADQAEASRFSQLQSFLEAELRKLAAGNEEVKAALLARADLLQSELRAAVEHSGNTVSAYIGELEDRLEHAPAGTLTQRLS